MAIKKKTEVWTRQQATCAQHRSCWPTWPACHWADLPPQWSHVISKLNVSRRLTKSSETELRLLSPNKSQETVLSHDLFSWMLDDNYKINQNQCVITLNYPVPLSKVRQSSISSISSLPPISSPPTRWSVSPHPKVRSVPPQGWLEEDCCTSPWPGTALC